MTDSKAITQAQYENHQTRKPGSIFVDIREWRDRTYGNTYYSARVSVDGEHVFTTGMQYGYGNHAVYECAKILRTMGYLPETDPMIALTREARELGIALYVARRDVLKRELPKARFAND